jgi:hypothetical protein
VCFIQPTGKWWIFLCVFQFCCAFAENRHGKVNFPVCFSKYRQGKVKTHREISVSGSELKNAGYYGYSMNIYTSLLECFRMVRRCLTQGEGHCGPFTCATKP